MKWAVLQYCVIRPAYVPPMIDCLRVAQAISEPLWQRLFLTTWDFIVKLPSLLGGAISTSVASHGVDETRLINLLDCGDRLDIRHYCHVLFDPALCRGLQAAQATPALAQIVLHKGSW